MEVMAAVEVACVRSLARKSTWVAVVVAEAGFAAMKLVVVAAAFVYVEVAVPYMVRPPVFVPAPIVEEARAMSEEKLAVPVRVGEPARTTDPEPVVPLARYWAPIDVVAIGAPLLSKAKMDEAAPLRKFQPIVVEATTLPLLSVPRMAEGSEVRYVVPELVRRVVEACCAFS